MLQISTEQTDTLSATATESFRQKSIALLRKAEPEFCENQGEEDLNRYLDKVCSFSAKHRIARESNVQRLLLLNTRYNFVDQADLYLSHLLGREGFGEDYRLAEFRQQLNNSERRIGITLETNLSQYA